ncbi:hypothetical protein MNBD_GAMMA11-1646 [hydrothermal vent metagenome]|uniref:DUF2007 domain-containing protein n=1 Tax=hydrothermal vent metagenome TaxID=652676 RepID=A0A3B0XSX6_9ZZZZ
MIKIYCASNIAEAQIVTGLLLNYNIPAYAGGILLQGGIGDLSAMDFATISVPNNYAQQARELIHQYEAGELIIDGDEPEHP